MAQLTVASLRDPDFQLLTPQEQDVVRRRVWEQTIADQDFQLLTPDEKRQVRERVIGVPATVPTAEQEALQPPSSFEPPHPRPIGEPEVGPLGSLFAPQALRGVTETAGSLGKALVDPAIYLDPELVGSLALFGPARAAVGQVRRLFGRTPTGATPIPPAPEPTAPPPAATPPAPASVPPPIPALTEPRLTTGATGEVATAAKQAADTLIAAEQREPQKRLYRHVVQAMENNEIDLPSIPGILQRSGVSMTEFIQEYASTVQTSARQLQQLSALRKHLQRIAADNPEAARALEALDRTAPNVRDTWWTRFRSLYEKVDNVRRASLTAQVATTMRNIISQTGRYGVELLDEAVQGTIKGEGLGNAPELVSSFLARLSKTQRREMDRVLGQVFESYPLQAARLTAIPTGEVTLGTKYAKLVNTLNTMQEQFFRRAMFDGTVRAELVRKGYDPEAILSNPAILSGQAKKDFAAIIETATDRALQATFAAIPKVGTYGHAILEMYRAMPLLTTINPFPRFLANSYKFLTDFSPAGYLRLLGKDAEGKMLYGTPQARTEILSQATLGTSFLAGAMALRTSEYAGEKWYQLKVGDKLIDTRPFAPFSTYLFLAEASRVMADIGIDTIKDGKSFQQALVTHGKMTTSDIVQGFLSINRIAGTGLVALDLVKGGALERKMDLLRDFMAQYVGGFTVPLRSLKDVVAAVSDEEAKYRDVREDLLGQVKANVPGLSQTLPESPSPLRAEIPRTEHPLLRQITGLSVSRARPIEQELNRLGVEMQQVNQRTGLPEADRLLSSAMGRLVDRPESETMRILSATAYQQLDPLTKKLVMRVALQRARKQALDNLKETRPDLIAQMRLRGIYEPIKDIAVERGVEIP